MMGPLVETLTPSPTHCLLPSLSGGPFCRCVGRATFSLCWSVLAGERPKSLEPGLPPAVLCLVGCAPFSLCWSVLAGERPKSLEPGLPPAVLCLVGCAPFSLWWSVLVGERPKSFKTDLLAIYALMYVQSSWGDPFEGVEPSERKTDSLRKKGARSQRKKEENSWAEAVFLFEDCSLKRQTEPSSSGRGCFSEAKTDHQREKGAHSQGKKEQNSRTDHFSKDLGPSEAHTGHQREKGAHSQRKKEENSCGDPFRRIRAPQRLKRTTRKKKEHTDIERKKRTAGETRFERLGPLRVRPKRTTRERKEHTAKERKNRTAGETCFDGFGPLSGQKGPWETQFATLNNTSAANVRFEGFRSLSSGNGAQTPKKVHTSQTKNNRIQ